MTVRVVVTVYEVTVTVVSVEGVVVKLVVTAITGRDVVDVLGIVLTVVVGVVTLVVVDTNAGVDMVNVVDVNRAVVSQMSVATAVVNVLMVTDVLTTTLEDTVVDSLVVVLVVSGGRAAFKHNTPAGCEHRLELDSKSTTPLEDKYAHMLALIPKNDCMLT